MTLLRRFLLLPLLPQLSYGSTTTSTSTKRLLTCANPLYRTMATANNTSPAASASTSSATEAPAGAANASQQPLALPEPPADGKSIELDVSSGEGIKLDHLGPMVVNRDGTLSRIGNWAEMTDIERRNTLRVLGKRNQLRMDAIKAEEGAEQK